MTALPRMPPADISKHQLKYKIYWESQLSRKWKSRYSKMKSPKTSMKRILTFPATPYESISSVTHHLAFHQHFPTDLLISTLTNPDTRQHNLNPALQTHNNIFITRLIPVDLWFPSFKGKSFFPLGAKKR